MGQNPTAAYLPVVSVKADKFQVFKQDRSAGEASVAGRDDMHCGNEQEMGVAVPILASKV